MLELLILQLEALWHPRHGPLHEVKFANVHALDLQQELGWVRALGNHGLEGLAWAGASRLKLADALLREQQGPAQLNICKTVLYKRMLRHKCSAASCS